MKQNGYKHNGLKLLLRFMKENGHGFQAVTLDRNIRKMIEDRYISIWSYVAYLGNSVSSDLNTKWHNFLENNGYYDSLRTTHEGKFRFIIYKRGQ